jgi:dihydrofolate reductase
MARLVYCAIASLDGYVADAEGSFEWAAPDEEVHRFVNDLMRPVGTYLYGRRMYEVMRYWETAPEPGDTSPASRDFARIWRDADKVVYSTTLEPRVGARTRVERGFDPAELRRMKDAAQRDLTVGGPTLAAHAFRAGLVDDVWLFLAPVLVGGGTPALPDGVRQPLRLVDVHRFSGGVVSLHYRAGPERLERR